jgi:hypothetical protein
MNKDAILEQLDEAARAYVFPMLDNGYVYSADVRMSVYRDDTRWLMIIEALGVHNEGTSGVDSFYNCLHLFGNALHRRAGTDNADFLCSIDSIPDDPLFEDEYNWHVRPGVRALSIRGERVPLDLIDGTLKKKGLSLLNPPEIDPVVVLRSLLPEYREQLLASPAELAERNPHALPLWLRLDEWHHPDLANDESPSESETFQMLADAIATGDRRRYAPTEQPNTDWRNWPEGGTL